jgi:hypothetical protein
MKTQETLVPRGVRTISAVAAMLLGLAVAAPVSADMQAPCGPFRVELNRDQPGPAAEKLEGFVYNESTCSVTDVRLHVVSVDAEGRPIAETHGWVFGDIQPGGRGYFTVPLTAAPAAGYRVNVISFDEVSSAAGQAPRLVQ